MHDRRSYLCNFIFLFTETAFFANLFALFGTIQTHQTCEIQPVPWLVWLLTSDTALYLFLRRERTFGSLTFLTGALYLIGAGLLIWKFSALPGLSSLFFALFFLLIGIVRAAYLNTVPVPKGRPVSYVELSVLGTAALLVLQTGQVALPPVYKACLLTSVLLCFLCSIISRATDGKHAPVMVSRVQGIAALGILAGSIALLLALFSLLPVQDWLTQAVGAGKQGIFALGRMLKALLIWLFPSIPPPQGELYLEGGTVRMGELEEMLPELPIPGWIIPFLLSVAAVGAFFLIRKLLCGIRLGGIGSPLGQPGKTAVSRPAFWQAVHRCLQSLLGRVRFWVRARRYRDTPAGMLTWLEDWGKRQKAARRAGETQRQYLVRVRALAAPEAAPFFMKLSQALDYACYAPPEQMGEAACFCREDAAALRRLCAGAKEKD